MLTLVASLLIGHQQSTTPGATLRLWDVGGPISELTQVAPNQTPNVDRKINNLDIANGTFGLKDHFVAEITAEFNAKESGKYTFRITSDDGSLLKIAGRVVATNDGVHPPTSVEGSAQLNKGWHPILVRFFEHEGGEELKVEVKGPSESTFRVIESQDLRCPANLTRVTSPGPKVMLGMAGKRRPGNGLPLTGLNPAWELCSIRPKDFEPQIGSMAFLPDGNLLVGTFKPNQSGELLPDLRDGKIWRLEGVMDPKGTRPKDLRSNVKRILVAENLQEPLGLAYAEGRLFVCQRTEISELLDGDHDGVYEGTKTVAKAWIADNYHHFTFGLVYQDGFLYAGLSTSITSGAPGINGPNPPFRGCVLKVDLATPYNPAAPMANCEFITGGHRTPNGMSLGPNGLIVTGENQGSWQPSNKINVILPGAFFGHYNNTTFKNEQYPNGGVTGAYDHHPLSLPALFLPQNECANSPSQSVVIPKGAHQGQMLIGDVKYGGLRRAWLEKVNGVWQGGAVQESQGFEVGTNRLIWGPDGCLYIGGIGATETWAWTDPKTGKWTTFGLQKIRQTGKTPFVIDWVHATQDGFQVHFSQPVLPFKTSDIVAQIWNYAPTVEYGGDKKNKATLKVSKVIRVNSQEYRIVIPGLRPGYVSYLNFDIKNKAGQSLYASECWYTLNQIPKPEGKEPRDIRVLIFSKTAAFRHDSIEPATKLIESYGRKRGGIKFEHTEDANAFNRTDLARFDVVLFLSTTGDVLNPIQQSVFENFIQNGGGYCGIHAAADTEYEWPFYGELVGAYFKGHPAIQTVHIKVEDAKHPTTAHLPLNWIRVDELYNYRTNPRAKVTVLASYDESSYQGGDMGDHPIMWCHEVGKGRAWYSGMGHTVGTYREVLFMESLYRALLWAAKR